EEIGPDGACLKGVDEDAVRPSTQQPLQVRVAHRQRQCADILAVDRQHVEGAELDLVALPAGVQGVEVGDAVDAEDDGLAIDHELLDPVLQRSLDDPREAPGPVVAAAGDQADAVAVALYAKPVTVVLDLMEPVGAGRDDGGSRGKAEIKTLKTCW